MKRLIFITLFLLSALYADATVNKHLSNYERAEVHVEDLLDGGFYKEADIFLDIALPRYPDNTTLLMHKGTALFNLKDLEGAKKYFVLVLEKDPGNEQASEFIEHVEEQEDAKENKVVEELIDYLSDSGLDFLMIFLAFLGGEIIARKYSQCSSNETMSIIHKFKKRKDLTASFGSRMHFSLHECCLSKGIFSFCSFLEILVTLTIVITFMIVFLLTEFVFNITLFISESLTTLTADNIWGHVLYTFITMIIITLLSRLGMKMSSYESSEEPYVIGLAEHLEKLYTSQEYKRLYAALENITFDDYDTCQCYMHNDEARSVINKYMNSIDVKNMGTNG